MFRVQVFKLSLLHKISLDLDTKSGRIFSHTEFKFKIKKIYPYVSVFSMCNSALLKNLLLFFSVLQDIIRNRFFFKSIFMIFTRNFTDSFTSNVSIDFSKITIVIFGKTISEVNILFVYQEQTIWAFFKSNDLKQNLLC